MGETGETTTSEPLTPPARRGAGASDAELARVVAGVVAVASLVVGIWLGNRDQDRGFRDSGAELGFGWEWCALAMLIGLSVALVLWFLSMVLRNQESLLAQSSVSRDPLRSRS